MNRRALSDSFVQRAGWGQAQRAFLAGDASDRSYDRLTGAQGRAVLMDAPPGKGDDPAAFIAMARHLHGLGLSAPQILAEDLTHGFLLLEDLGDAIFARLLETDPAQEAPLYHAAAEVLVHLQSAPAPADLADLTAADWAAAAGFVYDWYRRGITGDAGDSTAFVSEMTALLQRHADGPRVLILRDYHAENLLWLPERQGLARVGLLDFQLGQMGQPVYDLVSLLQDARRDVSIDTEAATRAAFRNKIGAEAAAFDAAYAVLGAQRTLRILGIFARLCMVSGKPSYLALMPRVWGQLQRNLAHPALAGLAAICARDLPEPSVENQNRIKALCPSPAR